MNATDRNSLIVWGLWFALFGVLELPAVFHRVPWMTLSDSTWRLESLGGWIPYVVLFALAALLVHLVARQY